MPSNEFERHIRQKMEGLSYPPRPAVWSSLEKQLKLQRRSKAILWWFLTGFVLLALSSAAIPRMFLPNASASAAQIALAQAIDKEIPVSSSSLENASFGSDSTQDHNLSSSSTLTNKTTSSQGQATLGDKKAASGPIGTSPATYRSVAARSGSHSPQAHKEEDQPLALKQNKHTESDNKIQADTYVSRLLPAEATFSTPEHESSLPLSVSAKRIIQQNRSLKDFSLASLSTDLLEIDATWKEIPILPIHNKDKFSRWWLGASVRTEWSDNRTFKQFGNGNIGFQDITTDYSEIEGWSVANPFSPLNQPTPVYKVSFPRLSNSIRFIAHYDINGRFAFQTGLSYQRSENGELISGLLPGDFRPNGIVNVSDLALEQESSYKFRQERLQVPIHIQRLIGQGKHRLAIGAGAAFNFNLVQGDENIQAIGNGAERQVLLAYEAIQSQLEGALQYQYLIQPGTKIFAGPNYSHFINGAFSGRSAPEQMRYQLGFEVGILWKLGK